MSTDYTVVRLGNDPSGRPVYMTRYMRDVWERIKAHPDVTPFAHKLTIVQGAFMAQVPGGGAKDSAGIHDRAGCLDVRTWNLTAAELGTFIRVARLHGFAFWRRDTRHGMDPHAHGVLGTDAPLTDSAARQWREYVAGGDGLAGDRPDYEWRPSPLVTAPPREDTLVMANEITETRLREIIREEMKPVLTWAKSARTQALAAHVQGIEANDKLDDLVEDHKDG